MAQQDVLRKLGPEPDDDDRGAEWEERAQDLAALDPAANRLREEAAEGYRALAARGDSTAAYRYAEDVRNLDDREIAALGEPQQRSFMLKETLLRAAQLGSIQAIAEVLDNIRNSSLAGKSGLLSPTEAWQFAQSAVVNQYPRFSDTLGWMYQSGFHSSPDPLKAIGAYASGETDEQTVLSLIPGLNAKALRPAGDLNAQASLARISVPIQVRIDVGSLGTGKRTFGQKSPMA